MSDSTHKNRGSGRESLEDHAELYQKLINSGQAWVFEGSVGREAMRLIEDGYCMLGVESHKDYYGNHVPSRTEVQPHTKGSKEFMQDMTAIRNNE